MTSIRNVAGSWATDATLMRGVLVLASAIMFVDHFGSLPVMAAVAYLFTSLIFEVLLRGRWGAKSPRFLRLQSNSRFVDALIVICAGLLPWASRENVWLLSIPILIVEALASRSRPRVLTLGSLMAGALIGVELVNGGSIGHVLLPLSLTAAAAGAGLLLAGFRTREEALIARDRRLATVLDCGSMYASNRELKSTLLYTVKAAVAETNALCGYIMLAEVENRGPLVAEVAYGVHGEFDFPATLDFGFGLSGYVAKTAQPIAVSDNSDDANDFDGVSFGVKSALSVPLVTRSYSNIGKASDDMVLGVLTLLSDEKGNFTTDDMDLLRTLASLAAVAIANARMEERQHSTFVRTLESLATALEARDEYTRGHSQRVCEVSMMLGDRMGFSPDALEELRVGTVLHDIGKIGVPDAILNKRGKLTNEEFEVMKSHTVIGYEICRPLMLSEGILMIIRNHHEKLDGSGYPDGLKGGELPLSLRIVCVADAFDAMSSRRPYRGIMAENEVLGELSRHAGTQFDPVVVEALKELLKTDRMRELYASFDGQSESMAA